MKTNGSKVVAVTAMVTFSLGFLKAANDGELPSARFLVGVGVAFTIVSVMTDLGSPAGPAFAVLIMLTAIFNQVPDVIKLLDKSSGGGLMDKPKSKKPSGSTILPTPRDTRINVPSSDYPRGIYRPAPNSVVTIS